MEPRLLSSDSAEGRTEGRGAEVSRRDTDHHVSDEVPRQYFDDDHRVNAMGPQEAVRRCSDDGVEADIALQQAETARRYSQEGREADVVLQQQDFAHSYFSDERGMGLRETPQTYSPAVFPAFSPELNTRNGDYDSFDNYGDKKSLLSTAKHYDHHESRKFLFKAGFARLVVTLAFCVLITLSLKAYEGFKTPRIISNTGVRVFNSIMLGLSLGLGLNLASSLKKYAVILRWSLLSRNYVSLEVFDLILGVETLTKVMKLMVISLPWIAGPGVRKSKWRNKLPWIREARDDKTRRTWLLCLLWILINIGAQILVAALSLFWPVDPSDSMPLLTYGNVTVSDLALWATNPASITGNASSLSAANSYGTEATVYPEYNVTDLQLDLSSISRNPIYKGVGYYEYRFVNRNPSHLYTNVLVTTRAVQARATCVELQTGQNFEQPDNAPMFAWGSYDGENWFKNLLPEYVYGSISWIGSRYEYCGPRCTNLTVYQSADSGDIKHPSLFLCNSTLSPVTGGQEAFTSLTAADQPHIFSSDDFARIATGAIAWTGYTMNQWYNRQTRIYLRGDKWSPYHIVSKEEIEDLIARFTIGAIAAFDDHGVRYQVPGQHTLPVQGQQLSVDWGWVLGLLGGICALQLGALIALIAFANKGIIRDESFFSLAMLLRPVVNKIGREGMNLSGEEIKMHPKLMWKKIRYDYRDGKDGEPNQVDIFFEGKDMKETRRSWVDGAYT